MEHDLEFKFKLLLLISFSFAAITGFDITEIAPKYYKKWYLHKKCDNLEYYRMVTDKVFSMTIYNIMS